MRWIRAATLGRKASLGALALVALAAVFVSVAQELRGEEGVPPPTRSATRVRFAVQLRPAGGEPRLETGAVDPSGAAVAVACSTCHSLRVGLPAAVAAGDLRTVHKDMRVVHGARPCLACHNPDDYDTLRLADGQALPFRDAMQLCAQCHGSLARDYEHGAHGGMTGHWDLTRGPRLRNQCVHCHDPHAPAFPRMRPTFKPRDRFQGPGADHDVR